MNSNFVSVVSETHTPFGSYLEPALIRKTAINAIIEDSEKDGCALIVDGNKIYVKQSFEDLQKEIC